MMKKILFSIFIIGLFSFVKLYGNMGSCIPSVLSIFVDSPTDLKCGSSNPKIVEIGNITTTRFSYQPNVETFTDVFPNVKTKIVGESDVIMNVGGLNVGSEKYVSGRYYTQEYYDNFDNLIKSESRFEPFIPGIGDNGDGAGSGGSDSGSGQGSSPLFPNSISNKQLYLNTGSENGGSCLDAYSTSCLDDTYIEGIEFNPDLKTIPIDNSGLEYSQSDYTPPQPVNDESHNKGDDDFIPNPSTGKGSGGTTVEKNKTISPELAAWKFGKIIESLNNYHQAEQRAAQKNKEYQERVEANYQRYLQQISELEAASTHIKKQYEETLKSLNNLLKNYKPQPVQSKINNYYALPTQFEYHNLDGQARNVLETQLQEALQKKDVRQYVKIAEQLMNSNDYELSRPKVQANDSGIIHSNLVNSQVEPNFLDELDLSDIKSAHNRELLRNVANKYQAQRIEFNDFSSMTEEQILLHSVGLELLQKAIVSAKSGLTEDFLTYLDAALAFNEMTAKFGAGVASGLGHKIVDKVMEVPELAMLVYEHFDKIPTTSEELVKLGQLVVRSAPQFKTALIEGVIKYKDDFLYGDEFKKGEVVGYVIGEAIDLFVPVGKVTSVTKVVGKFDDIADMSKVAKVLTPELSTSFGKLDINKKNYLSSIILESGKSEVDFIKNNTTKIASDLIQIADDDVFYAVDKLISSTKTFDARKIGNGYGLVPANKNFFVDDLEFETQISNIVKLSKGLDSIDAIEVEGYFSRFSPTIHLKDGASPMTEHLGNLVVNGRYSIGGNNGIDVMSYGFGANLRVSKMISELESGISNHNSHLFTFAHKETAFKNILDLTDSKNLNTLGINSEQLVGSNYILTQSLGALAKKKKFNGVIAPSARKKDGFVLHMFGDQNL